MTEVRESDGAAPGTAVEQAAFGGVPRSWALVVAGVLGIVAGLVAALPLALTMLGVIGVVSLLQDDWDATWNDGDLAFSAVGLLALLVLFAVAWIGGRALAKRARLPARVVAPATAGVSLVVAFIVTVGFGFFGR
ncbi:hypothetical protein [Amnibacterium sp.]|uniref:hypothetical protein n=1 Tax=Amnibacterium sp. TaxID=1872496 RepID=UPI003F7C3B07